MLYFFAFIYAVVVLPPITYLLIVSLAGIYRRRRHEKLTAAIGQIGVLVPAYNEAHGIECTLKSILAAASTDGNTTVHVIADNCTDNTAELTRAMSIDVLERCDIASRGKGAALQWAVKQIALHDYEYIVIIDADSKINDNFFSSVRETLSVPGCEAVQARYELTGNKRSGIKRLAMLGFNVLRARGRELLFGSAGIMGNGFVVSKAALRKVPFSSNAIVEDLEYHIQLVQAGICVKFCDGAKVYSEMPSSSVTDDIQSSRWEGGRIALLKKIWKPLLKRGLLDLTKGNLQVFDLILDLILLPIGYVVIVLFVGLLFPYTQGVAIFGLVSVSIYVLGAASCGKGLSEMSVLKNLPVFFWRKINRVPSIVSAVNGNISWSRTPRGKEPDKNDK